MLHFIRLGIETRRATRSRRLQSKLAEATCCLRDLAGGFTNGLSSLLLECTLPIPRDPLGLRHSRPAGFDYADCDVNLKTLFSLIFIDYPTILFASHVRSAQDDSAGSGARPRRLFLQRGGEVRPALMTPHPPLTRSTRQLVA